jgi:hypothetical protein
MSPEELKQSKIEKSQRTRIIITEINGVKGKLCSHKHHKQWTPLCCFFKESGKQYVDGSFKYSSHCYGCRKVDKKIRLRRIAVVKELDSQFKEIEFLKTYERPKTKKGDRCIVHNKRTHLCYECYPYEYKSYYSRIKLKRKTNENFRIKENLRGRMYQALKSNSKSANTETLIGCTIAELWTHIESQFTDGMTRENYGQDGWHLDHVIPCASFNLTQPREQLRCFNYRNLQPMWASENLSKGDKYVFDIVKEIELFNLFKV